MQVHIHTILQVLHRWRARKGLGGRFSGTTEGWHMLNVKRQWTLTRVRSRFWIFGDHHMGCVHFFVKYICTSIDESQPKYSLKYTLFPDFALITWPRYLELMRARKWRLWVSKRQVGAVFVLIELTFDLPAIPYFCSLQQWHQQRERARPQWDSR